MKRSTTDNFSHEHYSVNAWLCLRGFDGRRIHMIGVYWRHRPDATNRVLLMLKATHAVLTDVHGMLDGVCCYRNETNEYSLKAFHSSSACCDTLAIRSGQFPLPLRFRDHTVSTHTMPVNHTSEDKIRAIAGRTARCRCKCRYVSKFTSASRGFSATVRLSCTGLYQRPFKCWNYTKYADFHGVIVTLVLSCTVSEMLQVFGLLTPPLFHPYFWGCSGCTRSSHVGVSQSRAIRRWYYFGRIPTYVITVPERHGQTDGQTDRRHAISQPRSAVHGAVIILAKLWALSAAGQ